MTGHSEKLIACVAKENYDNFLHAWFKTETHRKEKQTVIFGAGILGMQFYYTLICLGVKKILFCDNDQTKWGQKIEECLILSPWEIAGKSEKYFIFLAMEHYQSCVVQIEQMGYQPNSQYYNLTNCSEQRLLEDFGRDLDARTLILGDCTTSTICLEDETRESIGESLYQKGKTKVLAANGLYLRAFYHLFWMSMKQMKQLKRLVILLNLDIFGENYHLFPSNQHPEMMLHLLEQFGSNHPETSSFAEDVRHRAQNENIFQTLSPNRKSNLSEQKIAQGRRVHLQLNYMYRLNQNTESICYLDRMLADCARMGIKNIYILLPVNFEMGERYFGKKFYEKYNAIKDAVAQHNIDANGQLADFSYLLPDNDFIRLRSANEGLRENGRTKLVTQIQKLFLTE